MIDSGSVGLGSSPGTPTKRCPGCGQNKPLSDFHRQARRHDGVQTYCIPCKKVKNADYHANRRDMERHRAQRAVRKQQTQAYVLQYLLTHPCVDCGETDIIVLEFDHLNDDKVDNVASMMAQNLKLSRIVAEIDKCEVRCANDHRRATARRAGTWKTLALPGS